MITHQVELRPFPVPTDVVQVVPPGSRHEGFKVSPSYRLGQLSDETLNKLCDEFHANVMKQARSERLPAVDPLQKWT